MQSDVARNMYPGMAVYQSIFNQLINICIDWKIVIFSEHFRENPAILLQTVAK